MRKSFSMRKNSRRSSSRGKSNSFSVYLEHLDDENSSLCHRIKEIDYHTFKHAVLHVKYNTIWGLWWDVLLVILSLLACVIYVMETYWATYRALQAYTLIENIVTQFFLLDFILSWIAAHSSRIYFSKSFTWIDLATIVPVYLNYVMSGSEGPNLSILRFLRILRLVRILKTFRLLGGMSGVKRQTVTLSLALVSLVFLAAGVIHIFENEIQQVDYDCQYINALTNYEPSCDATEPTFGEADCDCHSQKCHAYYKPSDENHRPSSIKCNSLKFFDSLFFVIITIYPVGYGSMIVTDASRAAIVLLIIASLIVIPIQINKLSILIKMNSRYRKPFEVLPYENHVLLCGFCNDKEKLSRVLREFFNPDRTSSNTPQFHMVIMTPHEPNEDVVDLMNSPLFDSRLSYLIGSALDEKDLLKARADVASAIFFISDSQADYDQSTCEDAATVLRTLSIINYNPDLECFVEVLNEHDKRTLEDCHADVVLCLDDYKFTLQARNSICMGLSTLCENLFNSFADNYEVVVEKNHWMSEYTHGLGMEMYYFNIDATFFASMNFNWALLVECVYVEFGLLLIGVARASDHSVNMNPRNYEHKCGSIREYYKEYNVGVVMAPDYNDVLVMQYALSDMKCKYLMLTKLQDAEDQFKTRNASIFDPKKASTRQSRALNNIRQMSSLSGPAEGVEVDHVEQAKVLSSLMRTQKYFDHKYSLKKCYQKAATRKTDPVRQSVKKSASIGSKGGHDSESDSEDDVDQFLGYIDDSDSDTDADATKSERVIKTAFSISGTSTPSNASYRTPGGSSRSGMSTRNSSEIPFSPPSGTRPKRNTFISASSSKRLPDVEMHDPFKASGHNLGELVKIHAAEKAQQSEVESKKNKAALLKFGGAAKKVTAMLKGDVWGDAIAVMNTSTSAIDGDPLGQLNFLDMPVITPLQRQIMQSRRRKKGHDTRISPSKASRLIKITSQFNIHQSSPSAPTLPDPLEKSGSRNFTSTLKQFQSNSKQRSFHNSSSQTLNKLKSNDFSSIEPLESDNTTVISSAPIKDSRIEKIKRFQSNGSVGSLGSRKNTRGSGVFSMIGDKVVRSSDSDSKDIARKLHKIQRALSAASSGTGYDSDVVEIDVGEVMGVLSPSVKRTLSKSKSKPIADTPKHAARLLRADSFEDVKVSSEAIAEAKHDAETGVRMAGDEKMPSIEIRNAKELHDHVIVLGCLTHIVKFVKALRKSNLGTHENYHSVLLVSDDEPEDWDYIKQNYKDIFFLRRPSTTDQDFLYMNLRSALSVIVLGSRHRESLDEATNIDSQVLFKYLAIERKIPPHVNITVEVYRPSSVGVINSAVNHNKVASGASGMKNTGMSRKMNSMKGASMKIAGNDRASFYVHANALMTISDDEGDDCVENDGFSSIKAINYRPDRIAPLTATRYQNNGIREGILAGDRNKKTNRRVSGMMPLLLKGGDEDYDPEPLQSRGSRALNFWGSKDTHHTLPVFAAGRAFVPTAFDSIFVQSFFSSYSLQTCEKIISGDEAQMMMKIKVPTTFVDRLYVDMFRALNVRGVLLIGLYRIPHRRNGAQLHYVFTNPPGETVLHAGDQMYVYGHPELVKEAKKIITRPLTYMKDSRVSMIADD